jgi:hypothetical protein
MTTSDERLDRLEAKIDKMQVTLTRVATLQYIVMFVLGSSFGELLRLIVTGKP